VIRLHRAAVPLVVAAAVISAAGRAAGSPPARGAAPERQRIEVCDARVAAATAPPDAAYCYHYLAGAGHMTFDAVIAHVSRRLADQPDHPGWLLALATLRGSQNQPEADDAYRRAIGALAARGQAAGEILARTGHAAYLRISGRIDDAEATLAPADELAGRLGDARLIARVRVQQAWIANRRLDYGRGLRMLDSIDPPPTEEVDLRSSWLSARAATLWAIGRAAEAREAYVEQALLLERVGNYYEGATARGNITLLTSGPSRRQMALETAEAARKGGNLRAEAVAYFYLAEIGEEDALDHARRSLELAIRARYPIAITQGQRAVALRLLDSDPASAFRMIDAAIASSRATGDPNETVRSRYVKANMRWRTGPKALAISDSLALLDAIEALRKHQPEEAVRAQRFGQWRYAYYRLAGHLLAGRLGSVTEADRELAFSVIERLRARVLLDRLDEAGATVVDASHPVAVERAQALRELASVNRRLPSLRQGTAEFDEGLDRVQILERQVDELTARLARLDPAFGSVHLPDLAGLQEVRQQLADDEAVIAVQLSGTVENGQPFGSWIWTITRSGSQVRPLAYDWNLPGTVDLFIGLLQRRDGSEGAAGARLYTQLLSEALGDLPPAIRRLTVIPDETLHRVPFDALREEGGEPLAARFDIALAPSATTWLRWRETRTGLARPAFILADPSVRAAAAASPDDFWGALPPLTEARYEGALVRRALGRQSRLLRGDDATEAAVKQANLAQYGVLHFAAHAVIDDQRSERSAVVLSAAEQATEDGLLQVREIVDLPLSGQLVVLSACRSAGGTLVPGEGALGLAHAFLRAGAGAVMASLWPIRDGETAELMRLTSEGLGRGLSAGAAVGAARRELIANGAPAAAWSGLVVIGDADLVPLPGGRGRMPAWWLLAAAACAVTSLAVWWSRVRRPVYASPAAVPAAH
jgi:hypothetical protein